MTATASLSTVSDLLATLDAFTLGYLGCALWSSFDSTEDGEMGEPLDANYGLEDLSLETVQAAIADCRAFQAANADDLAAYTLSDADAGHDFWLTRNRHGAGFWDRGQGAVGDRLSEASRPFGEVDLYVGEDGKIYGC